MSAPDNWIPIRCPNDNKLWFCIGAECRGSVRIKCPRCEIAYEAELQGNKKVRIKPVAADS